MSTLSHPLVVAAFVAVTGLIGNTIISNNNDKRAERIEEIRTNRDAILQLISSENADVAERNLRFLIGADVIKDPENKIVQNLNQKPLRDILVPVSTPCLQTSRLPETPAPLPRRPADARQALDLALAQVKMWEAYGTKINAIIKPCVAP
ncbi:hypothetical protein [uncultured Sphingosinicella sp.]|uniref:hypothetical protein n=1 Tax=uncultured Sphingosinicella sp. TaxID=478748 RepID=UPI0030D76FD4